MCASKWHEAAEDVYTSLLHVAHPALETGASAVEALERLRTWPRAQQAGNIGKKQQNFTRLPEALEKDRNGGTRRCARA